MDGSFIVMAILGAIGLYGIVKFLLSRTSKDGETVNWSAKEAVAITVAIYLISQILGGILIGVVGGFLSIETSQLSEELGRTPGLQFLYILFVETLSITLLYQFMKRRKTPWSAIGWVKPRARDAGYALAGFGAYFAIYGFVVFTLVQKLFPQVDTEQRQELGFDAAAIVGPELIFVFLSLVILPPLVEEIMVRGFLFTGLRQRMNVLLAAVVTSLVFAAAHLQWGSNAPLLWTAAADTFTLSMILIWLRQTTGSLWPGIGVHFIKNGIAFLALFVFKAV